MNYHKRLFTVYCLEIGYPELINCTTILERPPPFADYDSTHSNFRRSKLELNPQKTQILSTITLSIHFLATMYVLQLKRRTWRCCPTHVLWEYLRNHVTFVCSFSYYFVSYSLSSSFLLSRNMSRRRLVGGLCAFKKWAFRSLIHISGSDTSDTLSHNGGEDGVTESPMKNWLT